MLSHDLIVVPTQGGPPAIIAGSGRKAHDRIEHFLRAAIDNDNTRRAYGRSLGSFFAFLEDGGKERLQDIGPLDGKFHEMPCHHTLEAYLAEYIERARLADLYDRREDRVTLDEIVKINIHR